MAQKQPMKTLWTAKKDPKWAHGSVPEDLAKEIFQFEGNQVGVWLLHVSNGNYFDPALHEKFGLSEKEYIAHRDHPDGPFMYLPASALLTFCQNIGIHPAQMVPLTDDPRLSLHPTILQALIDLYIDDFSSDADIDLSRAAIECELRRFERGIPQRDARCVAAAQRAASMLSSATPPKSDWNKLALYYNVAVMGGDECLVAGQDKFLAESFQSVNLVWSKRNRQQLSIEEAFLKVCRGIEGDFGYAQLAENMIDLLLHLVKVKMTPDGAITIDSIKELIIRGFQQQGLPLLEQDIGSADDLASLAECLRDYVITDLCYLMEKNKFLYLSETITDSIDGIYDRQRDGREDGAHVIRLIVNQMILDDYAEHLRDIQFPQTGVNYPYNLSL